MTATSETIRERLRTALVQAMKGRDRSTVSVCRATLSALDNAEAAPVTTAPPAGAAESSLVGVGAADAPRRALTGPEARLVVDKEIAERRHSAHQYAVSAPERAAVLMREADTLGRIVAG